MGHITRTLTIARRVLAAYPTFVAYIATKSPLAANFTLPERCDYIKLPTLLSAEGVERSPVEEEAAKQRFRTIRGQILRFVFGLRDIMDDVGRIQGQWRELGVYDALEQLYDGIAVYGSAALYDVAEAYDIPAAVQPKLHYCGYVVRDPPALDRDAVRQQLGLPPGGPLIVATVGSGSDGYPVLEAAQAAVERLGAQVPGLHAVMVTGPFMPAEQQAVLQARATATCRVVSQADNFTLMAAADAVVSMGGYNSVCEALAVARPLVIVPRATHKVEQQIRAETLAARGLARWVHPRDLAGPRLVEALRWALGCDRRAHEARVREVIPAFDGAARLVGYLARWLGGD